MRRITLGLTLLLAGCLPQGEGFADPDYAARQAASAAADQAYADAMERLDRAAPRIAEAIALRTVQLAQLESLEDLVPEEYRLQVTRVANRHGLDPRLLAAVVWVETGGTWRPDLVGAAGEIGLMQVLPSTQRWLISRGYAEICDLTDPECALETGAAYLALALAAADGNVVTALREYNGGPRWADKPATSRYASRVLERYGPPEPAVTLEGATAAVTQAVALLTAATAAQRRHDKEAAV